MRSLSLKKREADGRIVIKYGDRVSPSDIIGFISMHLRPPQYKSGDYQHLYDPEKIIKAIKEAGIYASSALTLPEAKDVIIDITSRIEFDNTYSLAYKEKSYPEHIKAGKDFEALYNELDSLLQNEKNVKKDTKEELMRVQNSLKPGIFADALNKFEVTVERIKQPKFKHYKDPYPRFAIHLEGIELNLILRIHNADIKNKAYAYGLNVYEVIKYGLGGDLYFSSEVSSEGGVIVTYMSEKMLEVKPKDLNILAEKIGEILGDSSVSSALTLDEAREGIVDIIKNNVETFIIGRIKDAKDFERLYDEIKYILKEGMITIETVMKRLVATKRTLKKGIITDELMRLGMNKTQIEFSCSNVEPEQLSYTTGGPRNEIEAMLGGNPKVIHNLGYRYNFELDYRNKDNTIHVEMVRISPKGSGIYAVNLGKHMDIIVKGQEITAEYVSQSLLNLEIKDLKDLAAAICKALGISVASSAIVTKGAASKDIGAVDFRAMDMLIQPQGSFRGLDFSPAALSGQALEAMDLDKDLEGINRMTLGRRRTHPQRLKEYISACIFKGKIDEKADDFILSMLEVFQLQSEEGIESASQDREAVVLADTRGYVLPEKRLAASNGYSLN